VHDSAADLKAYVSTNLVAQVSPSEALNGTLTPEVTQLLLTKLRSIGAINSSQQTIPSNLRTFTPSRNFRLTQEGEEAQTLVYKSELDSQPTLEIHVPVAEGGNISVFQSVERSGNTLKSKVHEGPIRRQRTLDQKIALNAEHLNLLSEIQGFNPQANEGGLIENPVTITTLTRLSYSLETKALRRGYQYILKQDRTEYQFARRQDLKSFLSETATFTNEERQARHTYFTSIGARQSDAFKQDGSVRVTSRTRLSRLSLGPRRNSLDFQRTRVAGQTLFYEYNQGQHHYKLAITKAGSSYSLVIQAKVAGVFRKVHRKRDQALSDYIQAIRANLQGFERLKAVQLACTSLNGVSQVQPQSTDNSTVLRLSYARGRATRNFTLEIEGGNIVLKEGTDVRATQQQGGNQIQQFFIGLNNSQNQE